VVTQAGPAHPALLAEIHATSFPPGEAWGADIIAGHLSMPGVFALLCGPDAMIMARVALDEAEILTLAVAPAARRKGAARALLDEAMARAASRGAANMFLEVAVSNAAARALYEQAGFIQVGQRRRYYADGGDALVMARALGGGGSAPG